MRHDDSKELAQIYTEKVQVVDEGFRSGAANLAGKAASGAWQGVKWVGGKLLSWLGDAMSPGPGEVSNTPEMQGGGQVVAKSGVIDRKRI